MPQVCRTCLEEMPDTNCIDLNNASFKIKEELLVCLPEVDVDLVPDAVMCIYCVKELHSCYDFKQKCLLTEKQIRTQLHSQAAIDLAELKKDSDLEVSNGNDVIINVMNGNTVQEFVDAEVQISDDEDDDDIDASNLVLGLCESAPRKQQSTSSTSKAPTNTAPSRNNIPIAKHEIRGARKSTTKGAQGIISPIHKNMQGQSSSSSNPKFTCSICKASSATIVEYIAHTKNTHTGENHDYQCSHCEYNTKAPNFLIKHFDIHLKDTETDEIPSSHRCPHCDFDNANETILNRHIDSHILKCTKCYYIATSNTAYEKHMSTHSLTLESDDVVVIEDDEDLPCKHCKYVAKGTVQFEKHCLDTHGIKYPYECQECGYTTGMKPALNKHLKFHVGKRMFQCSFCTYNCDLLFNLKKHLSNRHNKK